MADPQDVDLGGSIRRAWLRGLWTLHHLVPGEHRHYRGDQGDPRGGKGMKDLAVASGTATRSEALIAPLWAKIIEIAPEAAGVSTYWLEFEDKAVRDRYRFAPGQFNMVYLPGYGEAAISISSHPGRPERIGHTVRFVGNVTRAISRLKRGDVLGLRGPFGVGWPLADHQGRDVVIAAGGIGLAPLRPALYHILNHRADYGKVTIIYGARTPADLLYPGEAEARR